MTVGAAIKGSQIAPWNISVCICLIRSIIGYTVVTWSHCIIGRSKAKKDIKVANTHFISLSIWFSLRAPEWYSYSSLLQCTNKAHVEIEACRDRSRKAKLVERPTRRSQKVLGRHGRGCQGAIDVLPTHSYPSR
jgi:hypothetical protein